MKWAGLKVGDPVAEMAYGAFSEWGVVQAKHALPVPVVAPQIVALLTSGLTASIGALPPYSTQRLPATSQTRVKGNQIPSSILGDKTVQEAWSHATV